MAWSGAVASNRELLVLLALIGAITLWSWNDPFDRLTWWMETLPVLLALPVMWLTRARFPLTRLVYYLVFLHAVLLLVGGHYTYARVPVGFWVQDLFELSRNHYDRLGHFAQGFVPALVAREILLGNRVLARGPWLFFLVTCFALALSAFYELIEWWAAVFGGDGSIEFLGVQGDIWDAQWDMLWALLGALSAQGALARWHDRQMAQVAAHRDRGAG